MNCRMYSVYDSKIILQQNDDKKIYILNKNLQILKTIDCENGLGHSGIENFIVIKVDGNLFTLTKDLELETVDVKYMEVYTYSDKIIQREKKSKIHAFTRDGRLSWTYLLPDEETIDGSGLKFVGKYGLVLTNNYRLIIIDLETGKVLYNLDKFPADYIIDYDKFHVVAFGGNSSGTNSLTILDIRSGTIICNMVNNYNNLHYSFKPYKSTLSKGKLYFICQNYRPDPNIQNSYTYPHIGRLDLETKNIDWIDKVGDWDKEGQLFDVPIVVDNRIYLKDLSNKAYIYEIED